MYVLRCIVACYQPMEKLARVYRYAVLLVSNHAVIQTAFVSVWAQKTAVKQESLQRAVAK
eukprot:m.356435 g.356435  ORF g.356435 m.356435 type:complete len:60 (-) comp17541_c0_seq1:183-362(-)